MKDKIRMVSFVVVLGSILTVSLVAVESFTAPIIAKNEARALQSGVLKALEIPFDKDSISTVFDRHVEKVSGSGGVYYRSSKGTVAHEFEGSGLQGPIRGVVALSPDRETIRGLTITKQEETPGLGGRIGEPSFLERFEGKTVQPRISITAPGKAQKNNEVDGIGGATLSCEKLEKVLRDTFEEISDPGAEHHQQRQAE